MILREIITKLGFQIDQKKLDEWDESVKKVKKGIKELETSAKLAKKAFYGLVGATTGLALLSLHTAKSAKNTEQLAEKLGMTAQELQVLELAAQSTGIGVGELSTSMSSFHSKLGDLRNGNTEASREIRRLGVTFTGTNGKIKSSFQLYEELAQKIDSIQSPIAKSTALQKIFGSDNIELARLFRNGGEAISKQRIEIEKLGYVIDSKGIATSREYLKSWAEFQIILSSVKKELSIRFMPVFKDMIDSFKGWYGLNRKLISQNISSFVKILGAAIGILFKAITIILTPINALIDILGGLENTVIVLSGTIGTLLIVRLYAARAAAAALITTISNNPITLIIAGITAIAVAIGLLIADLYHWQEGNESVIGNILGTWVDFKKSFMDIVDSVTGYFTRKFEAMGKWFKGFFGEVLSDVNIEQEKHKNYLNKSSPNKTFPTVQDVTGQTGYNVKQDMLDRFSYSPTILQPSTTTLMQASSGGGVSKKVNQYITENITVNVPNGTSGEQSQAIAIQVADAVEMQFKGYILQGIDSISSR